MEDLEEVVFVLQQDKINSKEGKGKNRYTGHKLYRNYKWIKGR
ncbi:MAG: hypothetical protein WKG06_41830 [Segetibacter sp.]